MQKVIDGRTYLEMRAFADPEPGNRWWFFTILVGDTDKREQRADIYIRAEVPFEVQITSFDRGVLRNVDTGKALEPPFILGPGEYHLEAVEAEDEAAQEIAL